MSYGRILKLERLKKGYTQEALGLLVGIDQSRISAFETGSEIPTDIAAKISTLFNSPRLKLAYSIDYGCELISIPYLDRVNEDVATVIDVIIEESEEVIIAGKELKKIVRNKKSADQLSTAEIERIFYLEEQIADLIPCLRLHFVLMAEVFDLDISKLERRLLTKFKEKRLIS
jgi:transcriptional regulator with XRE-family HTH domain